MASSAEVGRVALAGVCVNAGSFPGVLASPPLIEKPRKSYCHGTL
jgi:hypothetical protein